MSKRTWVPVFGQENVLGKFKAHLSADEQRGPIHKSTTTSSPLSVRRPPFAKLQLNP